MKKALWGMMLLLPSLAWAAPESSNAASNAGADDAAKKSAVRYKSGKEINFEELLIQGQLKRPEITVVTGDTGQGGDGILRLRENFLDHAAIDFGEEIQ